MLFIQESRTEIIVWNKTNGKMLFIFRKNSINNYFKEIQSSIEMNNTSFEIIFNESITFHGMKWSKLSEDLFEYISNVLSEIIGIGQASNGLINLTGLLNIVKALENKECIPSSFKTLGYLSTIQNEIELAIEIGRFSEIVEQSAYWNNKHEFDDCNCLTTTYGGYHIGALIGDTSLKNSLITALTDLVKNNKNSEMLNILKEIIYAYSVSCKVGDSFSLFVELASLNEL